MPDLFILTVLAILIAAPLLLEQYVRHLPIAPACPACRWAARETGRYSSIMSWIPGLARTFRAECGRCGWRGRMRWKLAIHGARRDG